MGVRRVYSHRLADNITHSPHNILESMNIAGLGEAGKATGLLQLPVHVFHKALNIFSLVCRTVPFELSLLRRGLV